MVRRRTHRADANQATIVKELRKIPGVKVAVTSQQGGSFPDLVVGFRGVNYLFEVKPQGGDQRVGQAKFEEEWTGQYDVIRTTEEALRIITGASDEHNSGQ